MRVRVHDGLEHAMEVAMSCAAVAIETHDFNENHDSKAAMQLAYCRSLHERLTSRA